VPVPNEPNRPNLRFVIDFEGEALRALSAREQIQAEFHHSEGTKLVADTVVRNDRNDNWRLVLEITKPSKAVDLRARLKRRGQAITETWMFTWQP
jgi:glucans biosynthesis protein